MLHGDRSLLTVSDVFQFVAKVTGERRQRRGSAVVGPCDIKDPNQPGSNGPLGSRKTATPPCLRVGSKRAAEQKPVRQCENQALELASTSCSI